MSEIESEQPMLYRYRDHHVDAGKSDRNCVQFSVLTAGIGVFIA